MTLMWMLGSHNSLKIQQKYSIDKLTGYDERTLDQTMMENDPLAPTIALVLAFLCAVTDSIVDVV